MKAIGYVRVSTEKQADFGISLEAQTSKIRAMAVVQGAELVDVLIDAGESAQSLHRPGMTRLPRLGGALVVVLRFCHCRVAPVCRIGHDRALSIWLPLILTGAAVAVVLAALLIGRNRPPRLSELGAISDHWLSQERAHSHDSER